MHIVYKYDNTEKHCDIRVPEVAANYIKYILKLKANEVEANGNIVTLKGSRVYVNGKASTWAALPLQVGE